MIVTTRSQSHQLGVMKSHTSAWSSRSTERLDLLYFIMIFIGEQLNILSEFFVFIEMSDGDVFVLH